MGKVSRMQFKHCVPNYYNAIDGNICFRSAAIFSICIIISSTERLKFRVCCISTVVHQQQRAEESERRSYNKLKLYTHTP